MKRLALHVFLLFGLCLANAIAQTDTQVVPNTTTSVVSNAQAVPITRILQIDSQHLTNTTATAQTYNQAETDTTDYHPMIAQFEEESAVPGDIVQLKLSFQLPKGMSFPEKIPIDGLQDFHVMGIDTDDSDITIKLLVDTIDTFDVPSLRVILTHENGTVMAYKSDPVMLTLDLPFDTSEADLDVHDIKDIFKINTAKKYMIISIICILILITGLAVWYIIKKRKQKIIEQAYQKAPEEVAFDALRDLNRDAHLFRDNVKAYYFRLTQVLKEYMGHVRNIPVAEMTTEEIASNVKEKIDIEMVRLMRKADMIKFADFIPTTSEREEHWKNVWSYVKTTSDERNQEMNNHV
jgi:hypothetical protein